MLHLVPLIAITLYVIGGVIYRLTLHPLAKHPGPFLSKITSWPNFFSAKTGANHHDLYKLHQKYGDVVRIGPNSLSFQAAEALHDIYVERKANVVKTGFVEVLHAISDPAPTGNIQTTTDSQLHAKKKRIMSHAFSEKALHSAEHLVLNNIRLWCERMIMPSSENSDLKSNPKAEKWSKVHNTSEWTSWLTFDTLTNLCFGTSFDAVKNEGHGMVEVLMRGTIMFSIIAACPIRWFVCWVLNLPGVLQHISSGGAARVDFIQKVSSTVNQRLISEASREKQEDSSDDEEPKIKDIFTYMYQARDPETGERFEPKQLVSEARLLIVAGTHTSATVLAAALFYLSRNEGALSKLQQEIRSSFGSVEEIKSGPALSNAHYLRAVLDETMRISPPVPTSLTRKTLPGGYTIDGHYVPAGIDVGVPIYTIHHNEKYYPEPHSFIPERWLNPESDSSLTTTTSSLNEKASLQIPITPTTVTAAKSAFTPFSLGSRGCLGKNLAYIEISLALARLVYMCDFRLAPGEEERNASVVDEFGEFRTRDWFISATEGPWVQCAVREDVVLG